MDIQGYIVEKLSGQSLPDFMRDHIFAPLGMTDAGFFCCRRGARFAAGYHVTDGQLVAEATTNGIPDDYATEPTNPSGGGGLVRPPRTTTVSRNASEWRRAGRHARRTRILAPGTVKLMTQITCPQRCSPASFGIGKHINAPGFGSTATTAPSYSTRRSPTCRTAKGRFSGMALPGTWFWVDPTNDIVLSA